MKYHNWKYILRINHDGHICSWKQWCTVHFWVGERQKDSGTDGTNNINHGSLLFTCPCKLWTRTHNTWTLNLRPLNRVQPSLIYLFFLQWYVKMSYKNKHKTSIKYKVFDFCCNNGHHSADTVVSVNKLGHFFIKISKTCFAPIHLHQTLILLQLSLSRTLGREIPKGNCSCCNIFKILVVKPQQTEPFSSGTLDTIATYSRYPLRKCRSLSLWIFLAKSLCKWTLTLCPHIQIDTFSRSHKVGALTTISICF